MFVITRKDIIYSGFSQNNIVGVGLTEGYTELLTQRYFFNETFKTVKLEVLEFIVILLFSMIPLFIHEIINIFKKDY